MSGASTTAGSTLLLDQVLWDLCLDASGNIAVASPPYAIAQDAASAIRLFSGELWYDTSQGIPYFQQILGKLPPLSLVKGALEAAALTVPGAVRARVYISGLSGRELSGQVQVTDESGVIQVASFGGTSGTASVIAPSPIVQPVLVGSWSSDFDSSFQ